MIERLNLENILFLDIETVPEIEHYADLHPVKKELWELKSKYQRGEISAEDFYERAGIWAEFGKIVCISVGYFRIKFDRRIFKVTSYTGEEEQILKSFKKLLQLYFGQERHMLCAHNGKEFDYPYIARRMIIHNIQLPHKLNLYGKKPWELSHLDTLELWKFGDYKHYTSLSLLTNVLGIPTPKDDIDGSEVREVYYREKNIQRIRTYCEKDTISVAQIFLRLRCESLLSNEEIIHC